MSRPSSWASDSTSDSSLSVLLAFDVVPLSVEVSFPTCLWVPARTPQQTSRPGAHFPVSDFLSKWCWREMIEQRPCLRRSWLLSLLGLQRGPRKKKKLYLKKPFLQSVQICIIRAPKSQTYEWTDSRGYVFFSATEKDVTDGPKACWSAHKSLPGPGGSEIPGLLPRKLSDSYTCKPGN